MFDETADVSGAATATGSVRSRLGVLVQHGYWPLPNLLMIHQSELRLTSPELNVLLNFMMHYHQRGRLPYPRTATIAKRMGVSLGTVQRILRGLKGRGFIDRIRGKRNEPVTYDPRPTLKMLERIAMQKSALVKERSFDELSPKQLEELAVLKGY
jgi:DNA-binding MarR family transcriptional regulator